MKPAVVFITGHNRGLGFALMEHALELGHPVVGLGRRCIPEREGLTQFQVNLADADGLAQWLEAGHLNSAIEPGRELWLINNAGTVQPVRQALTTRPADLPPAIALNVTAPMLLSTAMLHWACDTQPVRIMHISSGAARTPYSGWSVYCTTKAALDMHARAIHLEAHPGVRICSMAPGVIDTDMQAELRNTDERNFPNRQRFVGLHNDHALTSPAECARALLAHLGCDRFGTNPIGDVRQLSG